MIDDALRPPAARFRHYAGQRLTGADLQEEQAAWAWQRHLHTVALHDTWGIALGYAVTVQAGQVVVGPGLAYDCLGREILLAHESRLPNTEAPLAPDATAVYELVIGYPTPRSDTAGLLVPGSELGGIGAAPGFAWRPAGTTRLGLDVPLAVVAVRNGRIAPDGLHTGVRRYTQALARPHIVSGLTPPEQVWSDWHEIDQWIGLETRVDTSAAGFVGMPYYLADLYLDPNPDQPPFEMLPDAFQGALFAAVGYDAGATGFTFRLFYAFAGAPPHPAARQLAWRLCWVGIEPAAGSQIFTETRT